MKLGNIIGVVFILMAVILSIGASFYWYYTAEPVLEKEVLDHLKSTASDRAYHIESFFFRLITEIKIVATQEHLSEEELAEIRDLGENIHSLYVLDSRGIVIVSSGETPCDRDLSNNDVFIKGREKTTLINRYFCQTFDREIMAIATPFNQGVLVARIEINKGLKDIVKDRTGLGETGEVLVAVQGENERVYLFERLFEEEALKITEEDELTAEPIKQALLKNEVIFEESLDYRNEPVIAASEYIEVADMGLVAKIDIQEAVGTQKSKLLVASIIIVFSVIIIVFITSFFLSRSISKPITQLTQNVDEISKGKFDIQLTKGKITEVNSLTDSLNRVLASMKLAILRTGVKKEALGIGESFSKKLEEDEKYKKIYGTSENAIMILDPEKGIFIEGNPSTLQMFHIESQEKFKQISPWDLSPLNQPDGNPSQDKAKKMIQLAMQKGSNKFSWIHRRLDGEDFNAEVILKKMDLSGKTVVQATVKDLTKNGNGKMKLPEKKVTPQTKPSPVKSIEEPKVVAKPVESKPAEKSAEKKEVKKESEDPELKKMAEEIESKKGPSKTEEDLNKIREIHKKEGALKK